MEESSVELKNPWLAAFLAWLIPGWGHYYQGRTGKAILYFVAIMGLYLTGFVLGEGRVVYWKWVSPFSNFDEFNLYFLGQFFVGLPSLPALIQVTLAYLGHAPILGGFMDGSPLGLNAMHHPLGKLVEVASIYTTVAGLLNVFAIYDALCGPALHHATAEAPAADAPHGEKLEAEAAS